MFTPSTHKRSKRLVMGAVVLTLVGAVVLTLAGLLVARPASARIMSNTIDPVAAVSDNGREVVVTGPVQCTAGERYHLRVTVTQRTTGALAQGHALMRCTGEMQQWQVRAWTQGGESFEEGDATAVAMARSTDRGHATDAHQWLVNITLVEE
jgi:hypothetical protein